MNRKHSNLLVTQPAMKSLALALLLGLGFSFLLLGSMGVGAQVLATPGDPMPYPMPNSHTVARTASVGIDYDEPISPTTVNSRTFAVHTMQGGQLLGEYDVPGGNIVLTPTRPFYPGELVMASATTGTLSAIDNTGPLTPTVWQFRAAVDAGSGVFIDSGQRLGDQLGRDVELADLDGDGDLDAFVVNRAGRPAKVWLNNGAGEFEDSGQALGVANSSGLALGDIDGDGDLDAAETSTDFTEIWQNDGAAFFATSQVISGSNNLDIGDLDGDGDLDLFLARSGANGVWLNDGGAQGGTLGAFSNSGQNLGTSDSYDVALGDLDSDGDLDAFASNRSQGNRVWLNDGAANFTDSGQSLGIGNSRSVALGDLNADGLMDAFVGNAKASSNEIWFNLGGATFTPTLQILGNSSTNDVVLGDVDADGDLDSLWLNINNQSSELWLNDSGVFTNSGQVFGDASYESYGAALGDVNGDGDLDIFITNEPGGDYVWLNNLAPTLQDAALDALVYDEGEIATLTGQISDPDAQDAFTLEVFWGDGASDSYSYPAGTTYFTETHLYLDDQPTNTPWDEYNVSLVLYDGDGSFDTDDLDVTIYNVAPTFDSVSLSASVYENDQATLSVTFSDPGILDSYETVVIWGDGDQDNAVHPVGTRAFSGTHTYLDDDPSGTPMDTYTVTVLLVDDDTGEAITLTTTIVMNIPPVADAGPDAESIEGEPISFSGSYTDVGTLDTHVVSWDFGDGFTTTGTLSPTHSYEDAGLYQVTLTVIDDDTGMVTDTLEVSITEAISLSYWPIVHNSPAMNQATQQTPGTAWGIVMVALPVFGVLWVSERRREV